MGKYLAPRRTPCRMICWCLGYFAATAGERERAEKRAAFDLEPPIAGHRKFPKRCGGHGGACHRPRFARAPWRLCPPYACWFGTLWASESFQSGKFRRRNEVVMSKTDDFGRQAEEAAARIEWCEKKLSFERKRDAALKELAASEDWLDGRVSPIQKAEGSGNGT